MANVSVKNIDGFLQQQLKNKEFRRFYEIECAKVALAQKIAEMRQDKHMNQKAFAAKLGVSQQFISQIETGGGRNLTLDTLIRIAESLGRKVRISFPKSIGRGDRLEIA
jgi:DNA-binding XRE family transcriptional regulator